MEPLLCYQHRDRHLNVLKPPPLGNVFYWSQGHFHNPYRATITLPTQVFGFHRKQLAPHLRPDRPDGFCSFATFVFPKCPERPIRARFLDVFSMVGIASCFFGDRAYSNGTKVLGTERVQLASCFWGTERNQKAPKFWGPHKQNTVAVKTYPFDVCRRPPVLVLVGLGEGPRSLSYVPSLRARGVVSN